MYFQGYDAKEIWKADKELFSDFYGYWFFELLYIKLFGKKRRPKAYAGKTVLNLEEGNRQLKSQILSDKPFMAGRFGGNELMFTQMSHFIQNGYMGTRNVNEFREECENCGLFPLDEETVIRFGQLMKNSVGNCDTLCVWYNTLEDYFIKKYMRQEGQLIPRKVLDFWNFEETWTAALKGKKVLVIHPFAELIERQYAKRTELYSQNQSILPEFELVTLPAVQTIAGTKDERFQSWFDALDYMVKKAEQIEFDIALIGCGAYGFPLACKIKQMGKQAIHMGGVTQILFGIRGGRWDQDQEEKLMRYINDAWVRPDKKYIPVKAQQVENSCYW